MNADISIILPYWERQEALKRSLTDYASIYENTPLKLEFIVVDDGSPTEPAAPVIHELRPYRFPLTLIQMPIKERTKNPCVPINKAVAASSGNAIFLTSPECIHVKPVLEQLHEDHKRLGWNSVVMCSVYDERDKKWMLHSVHCPSKNHFANLMSRKLFDDVGGFDEDYREGYCFDDCDFVYRLEAKNPVWHWRDDLRVVHVSVSWNKTKNMHEPREKWRENAMLFQKKWGRLPEHM